MRRIVRIGVVLAAGLSGSWGLLSVEAVAQDDMGFRFVRVSYGGDSQSPAPMGRRGFGRGRGRGQAPWAHDYPTAELNLYEALKRTTRMHVSGEPLVLSLEDDRIFEYPVLYLCEPGYWVLNEKEAENLRDYLHRGGFILFDDFRGGREWEWFEAAMSEVLPGKTPVEIPPDHPVWSVYFDIDPVAAPSIVSGGFGPEDDTYMAWFDDDGRMIALACFNQDIGDGWEWPDRNFANASTISFQMGINFLIYALTH